MTRFVDIALLPCEAAEMPADCYVVVDVLRATTTIATMFAGGLRDVVVVDSEEGARARAHDEGRLLCGEVGGLAPEGFDHGNSPIELGEADLAGRGAVLFTTNGTLAFCAAPEGGVILSGALANLEAVAVSASQHERVTIMCAGNAAGRRFALEDFAAATRIAERIVANSPGCEMGDAAGMGAELWGYEKWISAGMPQQVDRSARALRSSVHGRRTAAIGFERDIAFASQANTSKAVPVVVERGTGWARLERSESQFLVPSDVGSRGW